MDSGFRSEGLRTRHRLPVWDKSDFERGWRYVILLGKGELVRMGTDLAVRNAVPPEVGYGSFLRKGWCRALEPVFTCDTMARDALFKDTVEMDGLCSAATG